MKKILNSPQKWVVASIVVPIVLGAILGLVGQDTSGKSVASIFVPIYVTAWYKYFRSLGKRSGRSLGLALGFSIAVILAIGIGSAVLIPTAQDIRVPKIVSGVLLPLIFWVSAIGWTIYHMKGSRPTSRDSLDLRIEPQSLGLTQIPAVPSVLSNGVAESKVDGVNSNTSKIKIVLAVMSVFLVLAILFPPFIILHPESGVAYNAGFHFIFSGSSNLAIVNITLLLIELAVILIVGVLAWVLTGGRLRPTV